MVKVKKKEKERRKKMFLEVRNAFGDKYSWLGAQVSREMLLSAATWNIEKYSDPPFRFRTHLMLKWKRGWVKSTMLRKMATILGDDFCSTIGKVTDAAIRGSVSGGQFTPPKPLKTPIVISTEFGQTNFDDELLGVFLALLEEGQTNIALNKFAQLSENQKNSIEEKFDGEVNFGEKNEFDLNTSFIFWGATHDSSNLQEDALLSRFNVVTPAQPLSGDITEHMDSSSNPLNSISTDTIRGIRRELKKDKRVDTDFQPPKKFYEKYNLNPRESRDVQSYMAARNWWGLKVNPEIMKKYIKHMKQSRKQVMLSPRERVFELILDNPMSAEELMNRTGMSRYDLHNILDDLNANRLPVKDDSNVKWVIYSGDAESTKEKDKKARETYLS